MDFSRKAVIRRNKKRLAPLLEMYPEMPSSIMRSFLAPVTYEPWRYPHEIWAVKQRRAAVQDLAALMVSIGIARYHWDH